MTRPNFMEPRLDAAGASHAAAAERRSISVAICAMSRSRPDHSIGAVTFRIVQPSAVRALVRAVPGQCGSGMELNTVVLEPEFEQRPGQIQPV